MVCACKYVVSSFILALIPAMSLEKIKLDGEINRIPFVTSLVISWLLPVTFIPSRNTLSSKFIRADGVEISENYHLNISYYPKLYLYRTRYNQNMLRSPLNKASKSGSTSNKFNSLPFHMQEFSLSSLYHTFTLATTYC